jgi:hypothetical protein
MELSSWPPPQETHVLLRTPLWERILNAMPADNEDSTLGHEK